jgi:protein-L-isoaspartate(D-aspartate) O-methyltransferase
MGKDVTALREAMVARQIEARGVVDARVLAAMRKVPRHLFVPPDLQRLAYEDEPLPIGQEQTISQPYIVAFMTEALALRPEDRVLEIGTGSGYQTAVLAEIAAEVWTVEIVESLARRARKILSELGYGNIRFKLGDGGAGWPEAGPFDAVMVTASPETVPAPLKAQLGTGGRMVLPVGVDVQDLVRLTRAGAGWREERLLGVRFVPLVGRPPTS